MEQPLAAPGAGRATRAPHAWLRRLPAWDSADDHRPLYVLAALMAAALVLLLYLGRGTTFFYDEWDFVETKYGGGLHSLLLPHNEHLSIVPIAIYKVLFHLAGLNHYPVYRLALVAVHLLCGGLVYLLAARRIGRWAALVPASLILFLGAAWDDLLWPFQIGFLGSVAGGLGAWLLLEREDTIGDVGAGAALALSLASSGLGIPFAIGLAAELAWRRQWRRLWIVAVPAALYLVWYSRYGVDTATGEKIIHAPGWAADAGAASLGALIGRGLDWGRPLAVVALMLGAGRLLGRRPVSPRLVGAAVTAVAFWTLTAISRDTTQPPDTSRYLYLGAVALVVVGVELMRGIGLTDRGMALAALATLAAVLTGLGILHDGAQGLRLDARILAAELGALQLQSSHAAPSFQPDPQRAPQVTAGPYLHTVRAIGSSPADSARELATAGGAARAGADRVLLALLGPAPRPASGARPVAIAPRPTVEAAPGAAVSVQGSCVTARPSQPGAAVTLALPAGGALIHNTGAAPAGLALRRFADAPAPIAPVPPGAGFSALALPADASPAPWHLQVALPGPVSVCGLTA